MKPKKGYHRHHVVPKHAGGSDDDDNLVYLTVEEHIEAHRRLYREHGKLADMASANLLQASLQLGFDEAKQKLFTEMCRRGAREAHTVKQSNGFYQRLGRSNSEKLSGRKRPDITAWQLEKWAKTPLFWFNDGTTDKRLPECPDGWKPGRLFRPDAATRQEIGKGTRGTTWWTDGTDSIRAAVRPGENWKPGRTMRPYTRKEHNHAEV